MKFKNIFASFAVLGFLVVATPAEASEESEANGGWDEIEGYWNNSSNSSDVISIQSTPDNHQGWKNKRNGKWQAEGLTDWKGQYHYTRAQLYTKFLNSVTVRADSQRQWGTGTTVARSPWRDTNYSARTFWGN